MPKPIVLKLGGKPFDLRPTRASVAKVIQYLDTCPIDEIFRHEEVSLKLGLNNKYLTHRISDPALSPYTATVNRVRYVGHPKAIAELKRQTS